MATVDSKTKLKLEIGQAKHTLPLYEDYKDFYNNKYLTIRTFNKTLFAPLAHTSSILTINAGVIIDNEKYYFLTSAFENEQTFSSVGIFYKYISDDIYFDLQKVLSTTLYVPENGTYNATLKINWVGGYNDYHNYRAYSLVRFQTRQGEEILTDTGMHSLAEDIFYPYSKGGRVEDGVGRKWMTLGNVDITLTAGENNLDLYLEMDETHNKHTDVYIETFQVELTYKDTEEENSNDRNIY